MNSRIKEWGTIGAAFTAGYLLIDALLLEKYFFEVNTFNIGKDRSKNQVRLLLLTDLHFKKYYWPFHKKLARKVNELQPDLILIAGDIIDETSTNAIAAKKFFYQLDYSIPKAVILGNHDYKNEVSIDTYRNIFRDTNCTFLVNRTHIFTIRGHRVAVTGIADFIEGRPSVLRALEGVGNEPNHLLLIHSPLQQEYVLPQIEKINLSREPADRINIKYIFAGHNHGGQVTIFGIAPVLPEQSGNYLKGWYNDKAPYLYVSRGFGTSTLPIRFGARSEVTLFNLGV